MGDGLTLSKVVRAMFVSLYNHHCVYEKRGEEYDPARDPNPKKFRSLGPQK